MSRGQALHTSLMMANFTRAAAQVRGPSLPIAQPLEYIVQLEVTVTHTPEHGDDRNSFGELHGFLEAMEPRTFGLKPLWAETALFAEH